MNNFIKKDENSRVLLPLNIEAKYYKLNPLKDIINFYFYKSGKRYFFKSNSVYTLDTTELFAMALANETGINTVKMIPAVYTYGDEKIYGLLSEDFVKANGGSEILNSKNILSVFKDKSADNQNPNEKFNTIEHHIMALKIFQKRSNDHSMLDFTLELDPNILFELKKQLVFSYVIANQDCHAHNLEYLIKDDKKNNKKIVTLAPLFDNSMSFLVKSFNIDPMSMIKHMKEEDKTKAVDYLLDYVNFPFQAKRESKNITNRTELAKEIASLIANDKKLLEFYNKLSKINAKKLFSQLKEKFGFITEQEIELASLVVDSSIKTLDKNLKLERIKKIGPIRHFPLSDEKIKL